jgi:uncharacterized membrane protein YhhN
MTDLIPAAAALLAGGLTIWFDVRGPKPPALILRPAAMILIFLVALTGPSSSPAPYKTFVLAGLAASLAGDVFMMLPRKRFTEGLACFLAAHGFYILAFRPGPGRPASAGLLLPFLVLGLLLFRALAPALGRLKLPVLVYTAALTAMAWLAAVRFVDLGGLRPLLAFAGALFFLASDAVLAVNRFLRPFARAQVIILGLYFPAQLLIALSV